MVPTAVGFVVLTSGKDKRLQVRVELQIFSGHSQRHASGYQLRSNIGHDTTMALLGWFLVDKSEAKQIPLSRVTSDH